MSDLTDRTGLTGIVTVELFDGPTGELKHRYVTKNLVTSAGDNALTAIWSGGAQYPVSMRLGAGSTAVAKTGAGAAIVTYLSGSNRVFDSGSFGTNAGGNVATYKCTWTTGVATTASPITEVVLTSSSGATDSAPSTPNTLARALIAGVSAKLSTDVLVVTWTITFLGA